MSTVSIQHLTQTFGKTLAINDLSLEIESGKITGLIGADGSGKTTLIRCILGLLKPTQGNLSVLDLDPLNNKASLSHCVGYMPQKFGLYEDLTILENLKLYADLKQVPYQFDKFLEFTQLKRFQNRLAGALSGGMKQKLGLACALLGQPKFLVLDEPSVGVDPISRRDLIRMVRELITPQTTVLWATAYLDEAHHFDTVIVLDKGRVIYNGQPDLLAKTTQEFEAKVIELMGGYQQVPSRIAEAYPALPTNITFTVEADHLEKCYGNFYAVSDNSFAIRKGEIFGLLGPNGAGKSTSFKMMCGLAKPTHGTARIMGIDIVKNPEKARSYLGYMAQKFSLYGNLSVRQNLEFFASIYGVNSAIREQCIEKIKQTFDLQSVMNQKAQSLPLGFKQRLSMACALIHNPPVLFLDEPTSGVDILARRDFWNHITALAKKGVTVLVTTHFMDEAEYCDRISLFYKGKTVAIGTPNELKQRVQAATMEDSFIRILQTSEVS